jgi:hypothetical protein
MSFENFTIANAIKNIARSINAIPKVIGGFVDITGTIVFTNFTLTFINRTGIENTILNGLNDQFQTAYERNANTSDQFLTRSVSNVSNAKSSNLVICQNLVDLRIYQRKVLCITRQQQRFIYHQK